MVLIKKSIFLLTLLLVIVTTLSSCQAIKKKIGFSDYKKNKSVVSEVVVPNIANKTPKLIEELPITTITKQRSSFTGKSNNPFEIVNEIARQETNRWLNRPTNVKVFEIAEPKKPRLPAPVLLKKGEFETTQDFQKRVLKKEQERLEKLSILEKQYQATIDLYNDKIRNHNHAIVNERNRRNNLSNTKYWEFVNMNLSKVLGNPTISMYQYDADEQGFYAVVGSVKSNLSQWVKVFVPINKAKFVKQNAGGATPILSFERNINDQLIISSISIEVGASQYSATLINKPNISNPEHIVRSKEISVPGNYLSIN